MGDRSEFEPAGPQARGIVVTVFWTKGERHMEAANMAERMVRNSGILYKEFGHSNDDVKDLGDDASFSLKALYVLKGDAFSEMDAERCSRQQAIALARKALARM